MTVPDADRARVTWWEIARRPRWIAGLLLALAIAASFAALGQWQIGRAVETANPVGPADTETAVALDRVDVPQTAITGEEAGRVVTVSGAFVADDWEVFTDRSRVGTADGGGGEKGSWVVGHLIDADGDSVIVALGWAKDAAAAREAIAALGDPGPVDLTGRYLPAESPQQSDFENGVRSAVSASELVNIWSDVGPIYNGYVVATAADLDALGVPTSGAGSLSEIVAPAPLEESTLNLLNIFYAIEWVVFAGFALYIWYRLVRDEQERENDPDDASASLAGAGSAPDRSVD